MDILKVISLLMDYPKKELQEHSLELKAAIDQSVLSEIAKDQLKSLLQHISDGEMMDLQESYESFFERGRSLSLLLFEHVHGESRERGQAMVDLMALYEDSGFEISVRELPDYLPLYLEYLATRPEEEVVDGINDVAHIITALSERLKKRDSIYSACFSALLDLADVQVDTDAIKQQVDKEERDDTLQAMDKVWEDEMVTFTAADAPPDQCGTQNRMPLEKMKDAAAPIHWVDSKQKETKQPF